MNKIEINEDKQYFLFVSKGEIYAVEALDVIEIVEYQQITRIPMMQSFVKGVTNIRGNIIAVVDLLERFGFDTSIIGDKTSLVILKKQHNDKELQIAIIIDEVYEVDHISNSSIEQTPNFGTKIDKKFIKSMANYNSDYIPILDIDTLLDIEDISIIVDEG